ncbi:MAG TPA: DUF4380 domain-containing protein [Polyangia bacterium]|nr:DUF4380 domain-containing protein [Polyangia bacterium]
MRRTTFTVIFSLAAAACSGGGGGGAVNGSGGAPSTGSGGARASGSTGGNAGTSGGGAAGSGGSSAGTGGAATSDAGSSGGAMPPADAAVDGADATASGPVAPVMRNGHYAFDIGDITFEVDPQIGGRITTLSIGQSGNLLTGPAVNQTYYGSTLWTSPESDWRQPPPVTMDSAPFTATATATSVTVTGPQITAPAAIAGVSLSKTFSADRRGTIQMEYTLTNHKQAALMLAPWEVTRVFPGGVTFFPTGTRTRGAVPTTNSGGITWFTYDAAAINADVKLYADGAEGWLAHADKGLLFIKKFGDVPAAAIAPNEGDVEMYTNKLHTYIEMEDQGAYASIAPGASTTWTVTWYVRRLPAGVMGTAGEAALVAFVRDTIK